MGCRLHWQRWQATESGLSEDTFMRTVVQCFKSRGSAILPLHSTLHFRHRLLHLSWSGTPASCKTIQDFQRKIVANPGHTLFERHNAHSSVSCRTTQSRQPGKYSCRQLSDFVVDVLSRSKLAWSGRQSAAICRHF